MPKTISKPRSSGKSSSEKTFVTLHDVAQRAGVSAMTVSNVIHDKPNISAAVRERVLEAIHVTGYKANLLARALAGGQSQTISVFSPQLNKPYAAEVVQGAAQAAEALDYDLMVMMSRNDTANLSIMSRLSSGTLLIQPSYQEKWWRSDLQANVISIDGPGDHVFTVDNYGGGALAMEHLLRLGHTRIGFVSGLNAGRELPLGESMTESYDRDDAAERLRAYQDGMARAGLAIGSGYVQHGDYTKGSGRDAVMHLLDLPLPPTAVFVAGDAMALGAIHGAQDRGLSIPRDLSVVGFDDLPIAAAARPGLTTVRQPLQFMGETAVKHLVAWAERGEPEELPPFRTTLIVRESTAPIG